MLFLGVVRVVEDYVIYPRLIRRGIHLHPLAVIVAVMVGAELDGVAGMFLAVLTMAIATVVYRHRLEWHIADNPTSLGAAAGPPLRARREIATDREEHTELASAARAIGYRRTVGQGTE